MGIYKISGKLTTQIDSVSDIQTTQIDDIIVEGRSWPQPVAAAEEDTAAFYGGRGVWGGGYSNNVKYNTIDYVTIATTGNATDFGDLTQSVFRNAACSNGTRGVFGGGNVSGVVVTIDYITIASTGNATDFGDLTDVSGYGRETLAACSDGTKGLFGGGTDPWWYRTCTIDYITIATTGNATDFGDLTKKRRELAACSDGTKGVFAGGSDSGIWDYINRIDYVTIATTGNAADFGDLTVGRYLLGACSDGTKGVFAGGYNNSGSNGTIDYITIATTANATDFGDLTQSGSGPAGCSDGTKGVFGGRAAWPPNTIDYVTIATPSNAANFGDQTVARRHFGACSGD